MNTFIESVKRLYKSGQLTRLEVENLLARKAISEEEKNYILN